MAEQVVIPDDGPETGPSPSRHDHAEEKRIALDRIEETLRKLDEMRAKELGQQSNLAKKLAKRKASNQVAPASTWGRGTGYGGSEVEGRSKEAEKYRKMVQASHNNTDESWAAAFHHIAMGESKRNRVLHPNLHHPPRQLINPSNRVASPPFAAGRNIARFPAPSRDISPAIACLPPPFGLKALLKINPKNPKKIGEKFVFVFNISIRLPTINIINNNVIIICLLTLAYSLRAHFRVMCAQTSRCLIPTPTKHAPSLKLGPFPPAPLLALSFRTLRTISRSFDLFHDHHHHLTLSLFSSTQHPSGHKSTFPILQPPPSPRQRVDSTRLLPHSSFTTEI
jgi:hypothetical protein